MVSIGTIIIVRRATRGGRGEASPAVFQKSKKRCPDFRRKGLHCVHPYVKFTIQNVVLRVSKRKTSQFFLTGPFFLEFLTIRLSECPNFTKPPLPWKIFGCAPDCYYVWFEKALLKLPKFELWDEKQIKGGYVNHAKITQPLNIKLLLTSNWN